MKLLDLQEYYEKIIYFLKVKKFHDFNSTWKKNLFQMREKKEEDFMQTSMRRTESMNLKGSKIAKLLRENKEKQIQKSEEEFRKTQKTLEKIKYNNMKRDRSIEDNRKQTKEQVLDKIYKYSNSRKQLMDEAINQNYLKSCKNQDYIKTQWKMLTEKELERTEVIKEHSFLKFKSFVIFHFNIFSTNI